PGVITGFPECDQRFDADEGHLAVGRRLIIRAEHFGVKPVEVVADGDTTAPHFTHRIIRPPENASGTQYFKGRCKRLRFSDGGGIYNYIVEVSHRVKSAAGVSVVKTPGHMSQD